MTNLEKLAEAFGVIGRLCRLTGDRLAKAYAMSRAVVHHPHPQNNMRWSKLAPRAERRENLRTARKGAKRMNKTMNRHEIREAFPFRPVIGHNPAMEKK